MIWRRHDVPGHEACRIIELENGWRMTGASVLAYEGKACRLDYEIMCNAQWSSESALVREWVGDQTVKVQVDREMDGSWRLNGKALAGLDECVDIDLSFSPSTNMLPIRRLKLAVGTKATVQAAWLRFPSFALERLEQSYTRLEQRRYRYESAGGRFVANVTVDDTGLVREYGNIWSREGTV